MQLAALTLAAGVILAGAGTAAATGRFESDEPGRVDPFLFEASQLVGLSDLSAYGELTVLRQFEPRRVVDPAAVEAATGLELPQPAHLPQGVQADPIYSVTDEAIAVFTLSNDRVHDELDGTRIRLAAGPAAAAVWPGSTGIPALIVARAVAPTATSSGVPFETVGDYLIARSGLPDDVADRLRSFAADGSTLPLPVPGSHVTASPVKVDGIAATVLAARDGTIAAVVWIDDGIVTVVAGSLGADEVLSIARGLQ